MRARFFRGLLRYRHQRGSVLIFSLIVLALMLISALALAAVAVSEKKASLATERSSRSFQVADTGVEAVLREIYQANHPDLNALAGALGPSASCNGGVITLTQSNTEYRVTFFDNSGAQFASCSDGTWRREVVKLKSQGMSGNTTRAVEVGIKATCETFLDSELAKAGSGQDGAFAQALDIVGNIAYVGGGEGADPTQAGLHVFDISSPANLQQIGFFPTNTGSARLSPYNNEVIGVRVVGQYAYLATYMGGLVIVDISTPATPQYVGKLQLNPETWMIEVEGNYAYATTNGGLVVIDITNKSAPQVKYTVTSGDIEVNDLVLYDANNDGASDYAYLAMRRGGVVVMDISNIEAQAPSIVQQITTGYGSTGFAYDLAIYKGAGSAALYVARHQIGNPGSPTAAILTYTLANPALPVLTNTVALTPTLSYTPRTVDVVGTTLFVGGGQAGIFLYDLTAPLAPVFKNRLTYGVGPGTAKFWDTLPANGKIFAVGEEYGLFAFNNCGP